MGVVLRTREIGRAIGRGVLLRVVGRVARRVARVRRLGEGLVVAGIILGRGWPVIVLLLRTTVQQVVGEGKTTQTSQDTC